MFTGIIEELGAVESFGRNGEGWFLTVRAPSLQGSVALGESVAVNGCCLTAVAAGPGGIAFDVLEETRRLTNFGTLAAGSAVNLERSLRADSRLGGHFVTGHIDGLGAVLTYEAKGADRCLRVRGPAGCGRLVVPKGSIAIDGISLTVADVEGDTFVVWIIPHTHAATNLRGRAAGDAVNLEFDMLGKYVEKLLAAGNRAQARAA